MRMPSVTEYFGTPLKTTAVAPFDRLYTSSYRFSIVTNFFIHHLHTTPFLGGLRRFIGISYGKKLEWWLPGGDKV